MAMKWLSFMIPKDWPWDYSSRPSLKDEGVMG